MSFALRCIYKKRMSGELNKHLADINEVAMQRRDLVQQQMLKSNPGPDRAADMLGWIQHQNNILATIDEIIFDELIYTRHPCRNQSCSRLN